MITSIVWCIEILFYYTKFDFVFFSRPLGKIVSWPGAYCAWVYW